MNITLLFPRSRHHAVEDSYGSMQTRLLIGRQTGAAPLLLYDAGAAASEILRNVETETALLVTDPSIVASPGLVDRLVDALDSHPEADAALPAIAGAGAEAQSHETEAFLTLRQFETIAERASAGPDPQTTRWGRQNPGLALARVESIRSSEGLLHDVLQGFTVIVERRALAYRYAPQRGFAREDLVARIPTTARSVIDLGCGEGALGAAIKERQECRVVGIELDRDAAAIAATRLDEVHNDDARRVIPSLSDTFEWIVGGDVVEHVDDPWSLLRELRRIADPESRLLLSIPNVACWPIVADLLVGRFDYTYAGNLCAGHLRFFTRRAIEDLLAMTGWEIESIAPHSELRTAEFDDLLQRLSRGGLPHSPDDLAALGYHVVARAKAAKS